MGQNKNHGSAMYRYCRNEQNELYSLEVIQKWAKQSKQSLETQNAIAEYRLRLNRKQGEWIEANIPAEGAKGLIQEHLQATENSHLTLTEAGIDRNDSPKFRILAQIPETTQEVMPL